MKTRLTSSLGFVAMAFLLATAITATAGIEDLTKAKVVRIKGSARYTTGTGSWQPLKVGDVLASGTVIQTAADSRVDLVLGDPKAVASDSKVALPFGSAAPGGEGGAGGKSQADQNFVRLMENTVLSVDKLAATDTGADIVTETQLDLRSGRVFGTVKKLTAGSRYEVKIPNGVAGVRGTIYMLSALGDCMVWEGSMAQALTNANGDVIKRVINALQKYDPRTDTISDMSSQDVREMNLNTSGSQGVKRGSNPWGPVPPNGKDNPYVSPKLGFPGPPPKDNNE
jgi:hypothetical protein